MLARAGAAGDVQTVGDDVVPGVQHGLEQAAVARGPRQLAEADQVREHLVRLAVGRPVHALARPQATPAIAGPAGLVPRLHDVAREVEVSRLAGEPVEQDDRLEDAGRGHADVGPGREDALLAPGTWRSAGRPSCRQAVERGAVSGVLVIRQQTDQVVLVRPDVPVGPLVEAEPLLRDIGAEVAVGLLAGDQVGDDPVELGLEGGIAGVRPGEGRRVQPLADVLADPGVAPGPLAIARPAAARCRRSAAGSSRWRRSAPQPAVQCDLRGRQQLGRVGQTGLNHKREGLRNQATPRREMPAIRSARE